MVSTWSDSQFGPFYIAQKCLQYGKLYKQKNNENAQQFSKGKRKSKNPVNSSGIFIHTNAYTSPYVSSLRTRQLYFIYCCSYHIGFSGDSVVENLLVNTGDPGSMPGSGRYPGEGNGNLLQYSRLENPMDRGACGLQSTGSQKSQI